MSVAADKAKQILESLSADRDFSVPTIDFSDPAFQFPSAEEMYKEVDKLTIKDLSSGEVDGEGIFDKLMSTVSKHVEHEFEENRITGAEYSTTYIAAMQSAMSHGVQFLLSRDASYWQAQQAQLQAITARVELETAKVRHSLMFIEANTAEANFGLTTMRLANEDVTYDSNLFRYEKLMPLEEDMAIKQNAGLEIQNDTATYNLEQMLPTEKDMVEAQITQVTAQTSLTGSQEAGVEAETALRENELITLRPLQITGLTADNAGKDIQNSIATYNLDSILPTQKEGLELENAGRGIQNDTATYNLDIILPAQKTGLDTQNSINEFNLTEILPTEKLQIVATTSGIDAETSLRTNELTALRPLQVAGLNADNEAKEYNNLNILPEQYALLQEQVSNTEIEGRTGEYNLSNILPQQLTNLQEQENLLTEQTEVQRAQTLDERTDGASVTGSVGKQKELYSQQITSYKRDAELKAAKVFSDAWTVMKTVDEGLPPPDSFTNDNLQSILNTIKTNNDLG